MTRKCPGRTSLLTNFRQFLDIAVINAIRQLDIHNKVPLNGSISYKELGTRCGGIDPDTLSRILRHAMTAHLFMEPSQGQIAHTIDSAELACDPTLVDLIGMEWTEQQPASLKWVEWLRMYSFSHAATETPYRLAFDTGPQPFYEYLRKQGTARNRQFNAAMTQLSKAGIRSVKSISTAYSWSDLPEGATMVDVGGGNGHVCIALAKDYPHINFMVQDMPGGSDMDLINTSSADIQQRVQFYAYDYNTLQPIKGAAVYFFLNIMHNNPTSAAVQILRNHIPALENGSRVLIVDYLVRERHTVPQEEYRQTLHLDLMMMQLWNAMERTEEQMKALFDAASKAEQGSKTKGRFRWGGVYGLKNSLYMICEGIWEC